MPSWCGRETLRGRRGEEEEEEEDGDAYSMSYFRHSSCKLRRQHLKR